MRFRFLVPWLLGVSVTALGGASELRAEPHPFRSGRFVETYAGVEVEFGPGQEEHARAVAAALDPWLVHLETVRAAESRASAPPLSPEDFQDQAEAILHRIAQWIALDQPTPLQRECYATFVACYRHSLELERAAAAIWWRMAENRRIAIWTHGELRQRLQAGESVAGFHLDAATGKVGWELAYEPAETSAEDRLSCEAAERLRLDHPANYAVRDGVAELSERLRAWKNPPAWARPDPGTGGMAGAMRETAAAIDLVLPVMIDDPAGLLAPAQAGVKHLATREDFVQTAVAHQPARLAALAGLILEEITKLGLVERYIGSADRRWLCEGTARFVAHAIARERAGEAFANEVYDLRGHLRQAAALQPAVDLRGWPAVEVEGSGAATPPLVRAHQAFATRAVVQLVREQGDDVLPRLWREIAKTPRTDVSMETVARALRVVAGIDLDRWLERAQRAPIEGATAGRRPLEPTRGRIAWNLRP